MMKTNGHMKPPTLSRYCLGTFNGKKNVVGVAQWAVGLLKTELLPRNPALNSDAVPNYKHIYGPHIDPLPQI